MTMVDFDSKLDNKTYYDLRNQEQNKGIVSWARMVTAKLNQNTYGALNYFRRLKTLAQMCEHPNTGFVITDKESDVPFWKEMGADVEDIQDSGASWWSVQIPKYLQLNRIPETSPAYKSDIPVEERFPGLTKFTFKKPSEDISNVGMESNTGLPFNESELVIWKVVEYDEPIDVELDEENNLTRIVQQGDWIWVENSWEEDEDNSHWYKTNMETKITIHYKPINTAVRKEKNELND